jgi:F0F1-type ATP synthase assembly protein I
MSRSGKAGRGEGGREGPEDALAAVGPFLGLGLTFAMAVAFFFYVGWQVDRRVGSTPLFAIIGAFVGAAGGFYYIVRHVSQASVPGEKPGGEADGEGQGGAGR